MPDKIKNPVYFIIFAETPLLIAVIMMAMNIEAQSVFFVVSALINTIVIFSTRQYNPFRLNYILFNFCITLLYLSYLFGFKTGMALPIISVPAQALLIQYVAKKREDVKLSTVFINIFSISLIIGSYDISRVCAPVFHIPQYGAWWLFRINAVLTILIIISTTRSFKKKAELYEKKQLAESNIDILTGIKNRRSLLSAVDSVIAGKKTTENLSCAILDIDDFKKFNDTYGHFAGDAVLKELGKTLQAFEDQNNFVGRWGGEEFVIVSTEKNGDKKIYDFLQSTLDKRPNTPVKYKGQNLYYTFTAGVAAYKDHDTIDSLINRADAYLYLGKQKGKNQIKTA